MKNITLSAEMSLIEQAREIAHSRKTTLNQLFREWLEEILATQERKKNVNALLKKLNHVDAGRKFSREEMNER